MLKSAEINTTLTRTQQYGTRSGQGVQPMKTAIVLASLLIVLSPSFAHSHTPAQRGGRLELSANSDPLIGPGKGWNCALFSSTFLEA